MFFHFRSIFSSKALFTRLGLALCLVAALLVFVVQPALADLTIVWTVRTTADGLASSDLSYDLYISGDTIYSLSTSGLSISRDGGQTFTTKFVSGGLFLSNLAVSDNSSSVYLDNNGYGLYTSHDSGETFTWKSWEGLLPSQYIGGIAASGNMLYVATYYGGEGSSGVSVSRDGGNTFVHKTMADGLGYENVFCVKVFDGTLYACTPGGLSISPNEGGSFVNMTTANGLGSDHVSDVFASGSTIYAATTKGLSISTDGGNSFTNRVVDPNKSLSDQDVTQVWVGDGSIYVVLNGRLYISSDGGNSFTITKELGCNTCFTQVRGVRVDGGKIYAATSSGLYIGDELSATNSVVPTTAKPGDTISYYLTYTNLTGGPIPGAILTDIITDSLLNPTIRYRHQTLTLTAGSHFIWNLEDMQNGMYGEISIGGTLARPLAAGTIPNTVTLTAGGVNRSAPADLNVLNVAPYATAGPDQDVGPEELVTLDGSSTGDNNGDTISYYWTQTGGPAVTLSGQNTAKPTFTAPPSNNASLTFSLTATDSSGLPASDSVSISVVNQAPIPNAGFDVNVMHGTLATLDGSASTDPQNHLPLTYLWTQVGGPDVTLSDPAAVKPTFTAPDSPTTLTFQLTVTDRYGMVSQALEQVNIYVRGLNPVANAGPNQTVDPGSLVMLDGSGSYDPDNNLPLRFYWRQIAGPTVTLSDSSAAKPTFTAPNESTTLLFDLELNDSWGQFNMQQVIITVGAENQPPVANAGPDQEVSFGSWVTLDGSGSTDPENNLPLSYQWTQCGGPSVILSGYDASHLLFFTPAGPNKISLCFYLKVKDSLGMPAQSGDYVWITVKNLEPVANAGPDQTVSLGSPVTLNGSASTDPENNLPLTYKWTQRGGPTVTLSSQTATNPAFTAPGFNATLVFGLKVTDSLGALSKTEDQVIITIGTGNQPPVADAGADRTVTPGGWFTLDGQHSTDPENNLPLTFLWQQTGGPTVTINYPTDSHFPIKAPDNPAVLIFTLSVTDRFGLVDPTPDEVVITVIAPNQAPIADASDDQAVKVGELVTLDGSGSSDPDDHLPLTYRWTQISGSPVTLNNPAAVYPIFTAPDNPAVLTFRLSVTDGLGLTDPTPDEVMITVSKVKIFLPLLQKN